MKTKRFIPLPVVALAALLCAPASAPAQAVLLTAGNFAVLGGTAVTNTGNTIITSGNVGSGTAVTGFATSDGGPGTVVGGGSIIVGGPVVNQAELDLITASNGLAGLASSGFVSNGELGGLTLLPGVYTFGPASEDLTGTLTLNANGEANAVWVFNMAASLTTSANSAVVLENTVGGGTGDGVFWNAETGAITVGASSTVLGNYLAHTSVSFDGTDLGNARALAQAGVTFASASSVNSQGGNGNSYSNGLVYGPGAGNTTLIFVPEPAAFLWLAPLGAMAFVIWQRRKPASSVSAKSAV